MPKLPVVSGREVIRALEKVGFVRIRQKGSHVSLYRQSDERITLVPLHNEIAKGTLKSILKDVNLSTEELIKLL